MKVSLKQARFFDTGAFSGNVFIDKEDGKGFNALLVNCVTEHYKTRLKGATRIYVITEGSGTFTTNGEEKTAEPYDFFLIADGDIYEYKGKMKLLEFNIPATDSSNEEKVD